MDATGETAPDVVTEGYFTHGCYILATRVKYPSVTTSGAVSPVASMT